MRINRFLSRLVILGCIVGTVPSTLAQDGGGDRPRRGGGGGPGGQGGPGGGGPGGRGGMRGFGFGGGGVLAGLVAMKEVREELKLDESQISELEASRKEIEELVRTEFAKLMPAGGQGGPPQFDQAKMRGIMDPITAKAESKLEETLDPIQLDRLIGLALQQNVTRALGVKLIASKLGITDEQKTKMTEIETAAGEEMRSLFAGGPPGPEVREKMNKMRETNDDKVLAVLTAKQKEEVEALKGEKFKFPEFNWGGGRGGPGGPGGPGGRGGPGGGRGQRGGGDGT